MSREVIFIPGMGCEAENTNLFKALSGLASPANFNFSYVNAVELVDNEAVAKTPQAQSYELLEVIKSKHSKANRITLVGHCMGAMAATHALRHTSADNVDALIVSPPLPSPYKVLLNPHVAARLLIADSSVYIKSPSHPDGVRITPQSFEQAAFGGQEFIDDAIQLDSEGLLRILCPQEDWNKASLPAVQALGFKNVLEVPGQHSLWDVEADDLERYLA